MASNMRFVDPSQTPSLIDRMANSGFVTTVNKAGYATYQFVYWVNHEFNPFMTIPRHATSAYNELKSGHIAGSLVETGYMGLDAMLLAPAAKVMATEVKALGSVAARRFGFFGGKAKNVASYSGTRHAYTYNLVENPGPLSEWAGTPAANFAGGKYNAITLKENTILYRAGEGGGNQKAFGQWFRRTPPNSIAEARIDNAIKPYWLEDGVLVGKSPIDSSYALKIPKGTIIYEGPVGYQGGIYLGGQNNIQIFIRRPWEIQDVKVISETSITGSRL